MKPAYRLSWAGNLLVWSDFTLSPSFKVKQEQSNIKVVKTCLLLVLEVWDMKPTFISRIFDSSYVLGCGPDFKSTV